MSTCCGRAASEHSAAYAFVCCECGAEDPIMFACPDQRSRWVESHGTLTGHLRWLLDDLPRGDGLSYTPLAVKVPLGHHVALKLGNDRRPDRFRCSCGVDESERLGRLMYGPIQAKFDEAHAA